MVLLVVFGVVVAAVWLILRDSAPYPYDGDL